MSPEIIIIIPLVIMFALFFTIIIGIAFFYNDKKYFSIVKILSYIGFYFFVIYTLIIT